MWPLHGEFRYPGIAIFLIKLSNYQIRSILYFQTRTYPVVATGVANDTTWSAFISILVNIAIAATNTECTRVVLEYVHVCAILVRTRVPVRTRVYSSMYVMSALFMLACSFLPSPCPSCHGNGLPEYIRMAVSQLLEMYT